MKRMAIKAGLSVFGVLLMLGYWTFFDKKPVSKGGGSHIPDTVLGGGGDQLVIDIDVNGNAEVGMMVDKPHAPNVDQPFEEWYQKVEPGHHTFTVELAPKTSGTIDLRALDPQIGNKLSWTVTRAGKQIAQETDTLDKALQPGYAQGLQVQLESEEQTSNEDSE